ncbi:hypothetical protein [Pseudoalteromonas piscicida]|uniref:Uncharacterized protein n=1 Tax=Pseudoalteromonas piscicida TaxID=43662 RepID=A0A2A5JPE8_PSEO7|nr:hypothetical protein [Pseudoalteromonas piscicida]PCK31306.1 hypothetical protein CEX98_13060 [Pseudoalteromonas piscicida]
MKYAIIIALSCITFISHAKQVQTEKVFTDAGYPYKNLIMKAEKVELVYSEQQNKTTCHVKVYQGDTLLEGEPVEVSNQSFSITPVQSCLARQNAKQLLSLL